MGLKTHNCDTETFKRVMDKFGTVREAQIVDWLQALGWVLDTGMKQWIKPGQRDDYPMNADEELAIGFLIQAYGYGGIKRKNDTITVKPN